MTERPAEMDDKDKRDLAALAASDGRTAMSKHEEREDVAFVNAMESQAAHAAEGRAHAARMEATATLIGALATAVQGATIVGLVVAVDVAIRAWFG